jgi:hypothetical protein
MRTVTLQMHVGATIYPTLMITNSEWESAKKRLAAGERPVLVGARGGCGCRGEPLSGGLEEVTLVAAPKDEDGWYEAETEFWGRIWVQAHESNDR